MHKISLDSHFTIHRLPLGLTFAFFCQELLILITGYMREKSKQLGMAAICVGQCCREIRSDITLNNKQESPANAKGTRDSSACMKAHCEQM